MINKDPLNLLIRIRQSYIYQPEYTVQTNKITKLGQLVNEWDKLVSQLKNAHSARQYQIKNRQNELKIEFKLLGENLQNARKLLEEQKKRNEEINEEILSRIKNHFDNHKQYPRTDHCYKCKRVLVGFDEYICQKCKWILCKCGSCGCNKGGYLV